MARRPAGALTGSGACARMVSRSASGPHVLPAASAQYFLTRYA